MRELTLGALVFAFLACAGESSADRFAQITFTSNVENTHVILSAGGKGGSCKTPCTLYADRNTTMQLVVEPPRDAIYRLAKPLPPIAWSCKFLGGCTLTYSVIFIEWERVGEHGPARIAPDLRGTLAISH